VKVSAQTLCDAYLFRGIEPALYSVNHTHFTFYAANYTAWWQKQQCE